MRNETLIWIAGLFLAMTLSLALGAYLGARAAWHRMAWEAVEKDYAAYCTRCAAWGWKGDGHGCD